MIGPVESSKIIDINLIVRLNYESKSPLFRAIICMKYIAGGMALADSYDDGRKIA